MNSESTIDESRKNGWKVFFFFSVLWIIGGITASKSLIGVIFIPLGPIGLFQAIHKNTTIDEGARNGLSYVIHFIAIILVIGTWDKKFGIVIRIFYMAIIVLTVIGCSEIISGIKNIH